MRSFDIAAVCGIILTAAPGMKMDKCISDRACAGLFKNARVWFGGNVPDKVKEFIPMFFGCEKAPQGTTDGSGNSCAKKITKCCQGVFKKDEACALVGPDESAVFNTKEGRFCVTCKATEAPVVKRMSNRPAEICRAEGEKVYVNKCTFEEEGICIPIGTYALHRKDGGDYDPVLICHAGDKLVPETKPKGEFLKTASKLDREALSYETACYKTWDGTIEPILKKCKFTYEGKSVCVQEGHVLVIPGNDDQKFAAFVCPLGKDVVGVRLSKSEHSAQESQLKHDLAFVPNAVSFLENPSAQCYGM